MHMYLWVCTHIYTYACSLCRWQGGWLWGNDGVQHLCGSKPRSGQLQWPMFKVNGGLRWLFISRLLLLCRTPLAQQPLIFFIVFLSSTLSPEGPVQNKAVHWDPFWAVCNPSQCIWTHIHATLWHFCRHNTYVKSPHPHTIPLKGLFWPLNYCLWRAASSVSLMSLSSLCWQKASVHHRTLTSESTGTFMHRGLRQ